MNNTPENRKSEILAPILENDENSDDYSTSKDQSRSIASLKSQKKSPKVEKININFDAKNEENTPRETSAPDSNPRGSS